MAPAYVDAGIHSRRGTYVGERRRLPKKCNLKIGVLSLAIPIESFLSTTQIFDMSGAVGRSDNLGGQMVRWWA